MLAVFIIVNRRSNTCKGPGSVRSRAPLEKCSVYGGSGAGVWRKRGNGVGEQRPGFLCTVHAFGYIISCRHWGATEVY